MSRPDTKRILIVKLSSLGDLFHALPAVHMIRAAYTPCIIDWVTHSAYKPLVECFADVDSVIAYPRQHFLQNAHPFLRTLRTRQYDVILDLQGLLKSAMVSRLAKGSKRIGPSFCREGSRLLYRTTATSADPNRHAVDQILDVVDCLKIPRSDIRFPVTFPDVSKPASGPHVVMAPASRWPSKNWPVEKFAEAARHLQAAHGANITLIGAPGEESFCATIATALAGKCRNAGGKTTLPEMGSIIASADVLVANDSGPVHMAAALGIPTVVMYGPTNPTLIGPYGTGHHILQPPTPCDCGRQRVCRHPDTACIKQITSERVIQAVEQILS